MSNIVPSTFNTPYLTLPQAYSLFVPLNTIVTRISSAISSAFTFFTQPFNSSSTGTFGNTGSIATLSNFEVFGVGNRNNTENQFHPLQISTGHVVNDMSLCVGVDKTAQVCYLQSILYGVAKRTLQFNPQGGPVTTANTILDDGAGNTSITSATITNGAALGQDMTFNSATRRSIYPAGALVPVNASIQLRGSGGGTVQLNYDAGGPVITGQNILDDGNGNQALTGILNCTDSTFALINTNNTGVFVAGHTVCANGLSVMKKGPANSATSVTIVFDSTTNRGVITCSTYNVGYLPLALNPNGGTVVTNKNILDDGVGNTSIASTLAVGTVGTTTGSILFRTSANANTMTLQAPAAGAGNYALSLPPISASTISAYPCSVICSPSNQLSFASQYSFISVAVPSSGITAMNVVPYQLMSATGMTAGTAFIVHQCEMSHNYIGTAYAGGGSIYLQYGGGGGSPCTGSLGSLAGVTQNTYSTAASLALTMLPRSITTTSITISNATTAYTTGTGTLLVNVWYSIITL